MNNDEIQSELLAIRYAVWCLAATLKASGHLETENYVARIQAQLNNMDKLDSVPDKVRFTTVLNSFIDDINRVKGHDS